MEPITWSVIAGLIIKVGVPATEYIIAKWRSGAEVTDADWAELKIMGQETPESLLDQVVTASGLAKDDPRVIELQGLIKARQPVTPVPPTS